MPGQIDAFLGGALQIAQPATGYRAGLDAVLLAAAAMLPAGDSPLVADVGSGVGTVGLCLARRRPETRVLLIERAPELVALAQQNVASNGL